MTKRQAPKPPPQEIVELKAPPQIQRSEGLTGALAMILPMFGSMGMMVVMAMSGNRSPKMILMSGLFVVAMLCVAFLNIYRNRVQFRDSVTGSRREYLAYLAKTRQNARKAEDMQREFAQWFLPNPGDLPVILEEGTRVGEREPGDEEFLLARVGSASQPFTLEYVKAEESAVAEADPVAESALAQFEAIYKGLENLPLGVNLSTIAHLQLIGNSPETARAIARSVLVQVATFTKASDVRIAVLTTEAHWDEWDWVKWLPHAASDRIFDSIGPARMIDVDPTNLMDLLPDGLVDRPRFVSDQGTNELPHLVIVNDGVRIPSDHPIITEDGVLGVTVIEIPGNWESLTDNNTVRVRLADSETLSLLQIGFEPVEGVPNGISIVQAEAAARRLATQALLQSDAAASGNAIDAPGEASAELVDLLGLGDVRDLDTAVAWKPRLERDRLRVPIGLTPEHKTVYLDIKESALNGMGPHGLIIGATGSGKSEVLRTLVLALAMAHSSEELNFVLIDFKGGATFAGMAKMPHVSAIITNLGDDLSLVDRMEDALRGEMNRRQELLRAAGNFKNIHDYERARKNGRDELVPLPALLVVADEFSELLAEKPDFVDMFNQIGRLGRSLGVHLLLSSQRLEEGRLRGLQEHLSYRIGLRTFSAQESRGVIGGSEAYELPAIPGVGYLKPDASSGLIRFRSSYVSGPPPKRTELSAVLGSAEVQDVEIFDFTARPLRLDTEEVEAVEEEETGPEEDEFGDSGIPGVPNTTFDIAVARMEGKGPDAHQVWLPPLNVPATLDSLMPDLRVSPVLGLHSPKWRGAGQFTIPVGDVDRPLEQRRDTLTLDLSGAGGHLAIVGGPQSGKSTFARTVVGALALTHTPIEVQIYVMDFGGGTFGGMRDLAHMSGVALRSDETRVRRMFAEIKSIIDDRERFFAAQGIESMAAYRRMRAEGRVDDGYGDIFLVIDGWQALRSDFDELELRLQDLIPRGLNFGLHVIATALRWMNFRTAVKDMFVSRIELRLGDALDSEIDRKISRNVPSGAPGRGLEIGKHHVLGALPRVDADPDPETLAEGVNDFVTNVNELWKGKPGPKLRVLPDRVSIDAVRKATSEDDPRILLGLGESRLEPFGIDFNANPHFFFFGDQKTGKTATLRLICSEIARVYTPKQAQIFAVDYRGSLLGEMPEGYVGRHLRNAAEATEQLNALAQFLTSRIPGSDVTAKQLRERSWWTGPEAWVIVDDYDLVDNSQGNPIKPLVPMMAQARDVGLHVIVARRMGGASRAIYSSAVIQAMNDLASPAMMLPGNPEEGNILGRIRPQAGVPGRGQFRSREVNRELVQVAWLDPMIAFE
jgi:type VII secretion protein eccCa